MGISQPTQRRHAEVETGSSVLNRFADSILALKKLSANRNPVFFLHNHILRRGNFSAIEPWRVLVLFKNAGAHQLAPELLL